MKKRWILLPLICFGASHAYAQTPTFNEFYYYNSNLVNLTVGLQVGNGSAPNVYTGKQNAPINVLALQQIQLVPRGGTGVNLATPEQIGFRNVGSVTQVNAGLGYRVVP